MPDTFPNFTKNEIEGGGIFLVTAPEGKIAAKLYDMLTDEDMNVRAKPFANAEQHARLFIEAGALANNVEKMIAATKALANHESAADVFPDLKLACNAAAAEAETTLKRARGA